LWESLLPDEARELPPELATVDAVLDEERFLSPFRRRLTARTAVRRCRSRPTCD
jgi:hypothetical protein